jgi:hypothetical protein
MTYGNRLVQHEYIHMREKTHLKFIQIAGKKNMKQLLIVSCNHRDQFHCDTLKSQRGNKMSIYYCDCVKERQSKLKII